MPKERIDKIISSQNIASRSEVKNLIKQKRIFADNILVKKSDEKFDPEKTEIKIDNQVICYQKYLYLMMNKPAGVLSASRDKNAKTVLDLIPENFKRKDLFPAGRLDKDTTGFILITNDGELAHKMLSPKNHVFKLYQAELDKTLDENDVLAFQNGISFGEETFLPARLKIIDSHQAFVEICEGKFHQVKKMFKALNKEVITLKRLRIGSLELDENLKEGEFRTLSKEEIQLLIQNKKY